PYTTLFRSKNKRSEAFRSFRLLSLPLWHTGTTQKLYEFIFRILFLSGRNPRLFFRDVFVIGLSSISCSPWNPRVISVELYALTIACLESRSGLPIAH